MRTAPRDPIAAFPRVRQSLLSSFDSCPQSTAFALMIGDTGTHRAGGGTILHRAIARCLELMIERDESAVPIDVAMAEFDDVIRQEGLRVSPDDPLADRDVVAPLREIADMRVALRSWATHLQWNPSALVAVEERIDVPLSYPGPDGALIQRTLTTQLDLLEIVEGGEAAVSWDWKSSWQIPGQKQPDAEAWDDSDASDDGFFQQRVHALAVFTRWPRLQRVECREFYVRHAAGRTSDPVRRRTFERSELPNLQAEFAALIERWDKAIASGEWQTAPGTHCQWCPRPGACPRWREARVEGSVTTREEAEKAVGDVVYLEALLRRRRAGLRAYAGQHGAVEVRTPKGAKQYGPVVSKRRSSPTPDQVRAAVARGEDPGSLWVEKESVTFRVHDPKDAHPFADEVDAEAQAIAQSQPPAASPSAPPRNSFDDLPAVTS